MLAVVATGAWAIASGALAAGNALNRIAVYGTGMNSCEAYSAARGQQDTGEITYINWLTGYLSGANATSRRRNNLLGPADFRSALYWLDQYCAANPTEHVGQGSGIMLIAKSAVPGAHAVEDAGYGPGMKSGHDYMSARQEHGEDERAYFDWLAGYLSGVNLMLLNTSDLLGNTPLTETIRWLDGYCTEHPTSSFADATAALVSYYSHRQPQTASAGQ